MQSIRTGEIALVQRRLTNDTSNNTVAQLLRRGPCFCVANRFSPLRTRCRSPVADLRFIIVGFICL